MIKKYVYILSSLLFLGVAFLTWSSKDNTKESIPSIELKVVRVIDKRFPPISNEDLNILLSSAKDVLCSKLGVCNIEFKNCGTVEIKKFFKRNLKISNHEEEWICKRRYNIFDIPNIEMFKERMIKYLKQWEMEELKKFLPVEMQNEVNTYEDLVEQILHVYKKKIEEIKKVRLKNGEYIITEKNFYYQSFINWILSMQQQDKYDIVITNGIIVNDDFGEPAVHSLLHNALIGGFAVHNLKRKYGRVAVWSVFKSISHLPYFSRIRGFNGDKKTIYKINGGFGLSHEIGHMLFYIPDLYGEPPHCLMSITSNTLNYLEGYKLLMSSNERCEREIKYVDARKCEFIADIFKEKGKYEKAIIEYEKALKGMPKFNEAPPNYYQKIHFKLYWCYSKVGGKKVDYHFGKIKNN